MVVILVQVEVWVHLHLLLPKMLSLMLFRRVESDETVVDFHAWVVPSTALSATLVTCLHRGLACDHGSELLALDLCLKLPL